MMDLLDSLLTQEAGIVFPLRRTAWRSSQSLWSSQPQVEVAEPPATDNKQPFSVSQESPEAETRNDRSRKRSIMEVDPLPSGQPGNGMTYTMEEWDALFPPKEQVKTAAKATSGPIESVMLPLPAEQTTGQSVSRFTQLCTQHGIVPAYTLDEVAQGCFSVKVDFGSHTCEDAGPYPSKRQAKENICRQACDLLETIPKPERKKRKSSDTSSIDEESWKSILNEYSQKSNHRAPHYQDHEINLRDQQMAGISNRPLDFACTLMIEAAPGHIFGSRNTFYSTKVGARRFAAKEAVLWLRAMGLLSTISKQQKRSNPDEHTGFTQIISKLKTDQSAQQLVGERSLQLGLTQPSYHMTPAAPPAGASGPSFYTAHARYLLQDVQKEPRLQGHLCETGAIFGQKNAKQLCAKDLLGLLDSLVAERRGS